MLILFPSTPGQAQDLDESFLREMIAAQGAGFETALVDIDTPYVGGVPECNGETAIYRGWMLTPIKYARLYEQLWKRGVKLINEPDEYSYAHELPRWYDDFSAMTPASKWFKDPRTFEDHLDGKALEPDWKHIRHRVTEHLGLGPYIVKDYVKSRKHEWAEACYIPGPDDIERVGQCFVERQGEDLVGGLVFRAHQSFKVIGEHPKSKMPLLNEVRMFMCRGRIIATFPYWGPDEGGGDIKLPGRDGWHVNWNNAARSNFFTVDMAQEAHSNKWHVIELGDGQVAGLPDHVDADMFYQALRARFVV